jgi:hypothetical protein
VAYKGIPELNGKADVADLGQALKGNQAAVEEANKRIAAGECPTVEENHQAIEEPKE